MTTRRNLLITLLTALTLPAFPQQLSQPIYTVAHIDLMPDQLPRTQPILTAYVTRASHDSNLLHVELLQQLDHPNHFTLLETLRDRHAYDTHVQAPYVRTFRTQLQPALGSPYDERLHTLLAPQP